MFVHTLTARPNCYMELNAATFARGNTLTKKWRSSSQNILPQNITDRKRTATEGYDIYPCRALGTGKIFNGYKSLAAWIVEQKNVRIDGYIGIFWEHVAHLLAAELEETGLTVKWTYLSGKMKSSTAIDTLVAPFLGDPESVWGKKCQLNITEFFDKEALDTSSIDDGYDINIAIGIGAALLDWPAPVIYLEVPKNEIQYRFRAGVLTNLGSDHAESQTAMYKRLYFVDWVILNEHKKNITADIAIVADAQWNDSLNWIFNRDLQQGLEALSRSVFRVRPWFEAGAWGGHWMRERFEGLNKDEVNYAWSFELIVPENGLVFESDGNLLEVSFDCLMFSHYNAVLGKHADIFGLEFPIRFDFLDTWDGGNLSIQCHPTIEYIRKEFGEFITQDETYYILDCKKDAQVYLGFQQDINRDEFEQELRHSQQFNKEIQITRFVQSHPANKHDLFLIPNGTIHSAGANNLVLEISATPYIFTFKMYDWMRLGLDGQPRPINIDHAFNNLNFERKGNKVLEELISSPVVIDNGADWQLVHVPTHQAHFYDVHRIEFDSEITIETKNVCHILMLVEGSAISIETKNGTSSKFHYAETIVIPAAAGSYKITNTGSGRARVVKAFVKDEVSLSSK
jgi:mannose-6-phosphate isomerase class I